MKTDTITPPPKWYWVISIFALVWYLMDMSAFFMRTFMLEGMLSGKPQEQQSLYLSMPVWLNVVFAAEVFGGVLGSVCLLLKKQWALIPFSISIVGVLVQTSYVYFLSEAVNVLGVTAIIMPLVAVLIGAGMIAFTKSAISKNWIF